MQEKEIILDVEKILQSFAPEIDLDSVNPRGLIREQFEIDSLDYVNFIIRLHEKYGIEIPESDYSQISTLEDIAHYILTAMSEKK